jgi:hypothetical protein
MLGRACCLLLIATLAGCGEQGSPAATGWTTHEDPERGYSVRYPPSWHRATERMSRIEDPRELLTVATTSLSWRATNCEAFAGAAGSGMAPEDVAVTVWERGHDRESEWRDFPPRPQQFGPVPDAGPADDGCGEPPGTIIHWRNFADGDRHLHTLVRIGPNAPSSAAADAWLILDALHLDPGFTPSWPASG